jgi:hypothetical protein
MIFFICFILVRHTINITNDKTVPSSVTVDDFTTLSRHNLTCYGSHRTIIRGSMFDLFDLCMIIVTYYIYM